jgi:hypothetical protein
VVTVVPVDAFVTEAAAADDSRSVARAGLLFWHAVVAINSASAHHTEIDFNFMPLLSS